MRLPSLSLKLPDLPPPVAISASVILGSLVLLGILIPTLGSATDDAISTNGHLKSEVAQATKDVAEAGDDFRYVTDNQARFETLIQGDRLVPHTNLAAIRQIRTLALQHGFTALNVDLAVAGDKSLATVSSQVQAKPAQSQETTYRVNVETVDLKVGAALDGQIYEFITDLGQNFPGAAVVQSVELQRAPKVTDGMLKQISQGQDAGLVKGEIKFLWRTAQANEPDKK